jgi:hypothetical protein
MRATHGARRAPRQDAKTRQMLGLVKAVVPAMVQGVRPPPPLTPADAQRTHEVLKRSLDGHATGTRRVLDGHATGTRRARDGHYYSG